MKTKYLISMFAILLALQAPAAPVCQQLLSSTSITAQDELANALKLSDLLNKELFSQSRKLQVKLKKKNEVFDVICLGAGPQCAAASLVLGQSKLKSLVVEKTNVVASNFAQKDFIINSSETDILSMHNFPGGVIKFDQVISQKYANSRQLAAYIQAQQYQSGVPVLFQTEIIGFRIDKQGDSSVVVLKTKSGQELRAKRLLIGTGLGEANTKVPTPEYRAMFKHLVNKSSVEPHALQKIMSTETFMKALNIAPHRKTKIEMPKRLVIIGNGDGARITVEELLEPYVVLPKDFQILWIGNNAKTAEEYVMSQNGWDRYIDKVVPHYQANRIVAIDGYAMEGKLLDNGTLKIRVENPTTKVSTEVEADMVIDSTGYENVILKVLAQDLGEATLKDVKGSMPERELTGISIARQVTTQSQETPIYFIGPATGPLLSKDQMSKLPNRNGVSIYNNIGLTSAFVSDLLKLPELQRDLGQKDGRNQVESADSLFARIKLARPVK
jgi:ribulose 1,5-bisphosphate synthetase/thiazole synthase